MPYGETKIYYDGSHYIAIPHTTRPPRRRRKKMQEKTITVVEKHISSAENDADTHAKNAPVSATIDEALENNAIDANDSTASIKIKEPVRFTKEMTCKDLFEKVYAESSSVSRSERRKNLIEAIRPYFNSDEDTETYVGIQLDRKLRNLICRRIRCVRKANLQQFNYFVTFTYDDKLHTEVTFRKKLIKCLSHFCIRKNWRYLGVWERSPQKQRLHFHGLFRVPEDTMPGILYEQNDYSFSAHRRQTTVQNTYFNEWFGRCDFELIDNQNKLGDALGYIMKYLEKSGEKIVYSKGLPQYFISDIMDEDVVCRIGMEDKKLLLFDDFRCWDEGCLIGNVSEETIKQLRTSN